MQHSFTSHPDHGELSRRIERLVQTEAPRLRRLWSYYRNPMLPTLSAAATQGSDRPYRLAQEWGLPSRITGLRNASESGAGDPVDGVARKEVVIENDIGWRVETMVDSLFGSPIAIRSTVPDAHRRDQIEAILRRILANHGGVTFLQQLALLGAVHGFVDVLVKFDRSAPAANDAAPASDLATGGAGAPAGACDAADIARALPPHAGPASESGESSAADPGAASSTPLDARLSSIARMIRLEIVEPARALPLLDPNDWRGVAAYVQCYAIPRNEAPARSSTWIDRIARKFASGRRTEGFFSPRETARVIEILTARAWERYQDDKLVARGSNSLGILPLVHIQNTAVPFEYSGASDVEPLIPLQDELNTRLCDRGNRITMQSFKMYLGKGIENFTSLPIAPGRMWMTENENAQIIEFGGDASSPSEDRHIAELREAMDKISGVTPIAAGIVRNRIGHLTSAAALRVTLLALLARTARKRITYGGGIARMCELSLAWLDRAGVFPNSGDERQIEIDWPQPLPDLNP